MADKIIEHLRAHTGRAWIEMTRKAPQGHVVVSVSDNGEELCILIRRDNAYTRSSCKTEPTVFIPNFATYTSPAEWELALKKETLRAWAMVEARARSSNLTRVDYH